MSGSRKDDIPVYIDIRGENRKVVDEIVDVVLRRVLGEDDPDVTANPVESRASSTSSSTPSALPINQLLSSSLIQPTTISAPIALSQFQMAICQTLVAGNPFSFPAFGGPSSIFPLFVPPSQPTVESIEMLRLLQNILAKQKK